MYAWDSTQALHKHLLSIKIANHFESQHRLATELQYNTSPMQGAYIAYLKASRYNYGYITAALTYSGKLSAVSWTWRLLCRLDTGHHLGWLHVRKRTLYWMACTSQTKPIVLFCMLTRWIAHMSNSYCKPSIIALQHSAARSLLASRVTCVHIGATSGQPAHLSLPKGCSCWL